jgi:hypothetical protein
MVADDPTNKIKLKTFHCEIINNHELLKQETDSYKELPVITQVNTKMVMENFHRIKSEITDLISSEIERILNTPGLQTLNSS